MSDAPVYVVSGLPRSGTSLMMRMLEAAGIAPLTDHQRSADEDNPRGYYELERVKRLADDDSWVADEAPGRALKVISELLPLLPAGPRYKVIFMRRQLDEVLRSQGKMLVRRGAGDGEPDPEMKRHFILHLEEVERLLDGREDIDPLYLSYNRLLTAPKRQLERLADFLGEVDREAMAAVIEPGLYRNRA
jgi:hypothetical protein